MVLAQPSKTYCRRNGDSSYLLWSRDECDTVVPLKVAIPIESWSKYQIVVDDDEITTRNFNSYNWMLCKTIRRREICTVIEKEQGLLISRKGRAATRYLFGGIWIPKHLADYEHLKRLVLSWKAEQAA